MPTEQQRVRGWVFTDWATGSTIDDRLAFYQNVSDDRAIVYMVIGDETGGLEGKRHLQGFVRFAHPRTMTGVKRFFNSGSLHLEPQRGTNSQASEYCEKDNVVLKVGTVPAGSGGSAWDVIVSMIRDGATNIDIMSRYPEFYARYSTGIDRIRMELASQQLNSWREVEVEYWWGPTGTGKTRTAIAQADHPSDVYRVTDYKHPWDNYRGQSTIVLEEFRSSLKIEDMLIYLDGYFHELPCRYANKMALWDRVIIATNIPLDTQYPQVQFNRPETWEAFLRRINTVLHIGPDGAVD